MDAKRPVLTPIITDTGSEGYICDDCLMKEETEQSHSLLAMWLVISAAFLVLGAYIRYVVIIIDSTALGFLQIESGYAGLGVIVTVSVAAIMASEQAIRTRKDLDQQAATVPNPSLLVSGTRSRLSGIFNQRDRTERNRQNVTLIGESIIIGTLGVFSAVITTTLVGGIHTQASSAYASAMAFVITLWIAFHLARLVVVGRQTDSMRPFLQANRLRSIDSRLRRLSGLPGTPSQTLMLYMVFLLGIWCVDAFVQWITTGKLWNSFVWEITSLALTLLLIVCALETGRRNLLSDDRLWSWKVYRFTLSVVLAMAQCLSAIIGLLGGSFSLTGWRAWISWGVALLAWAASTTILCRIAWGASGCGRLKILSKYDATAFVLHTEETTAPVDEIVAQDGEKLPHIMRWLVLLLLLPILQADAAALAYEGTVSKWFLIWTCSSGSIPTLLGVMTMYLYSWSRTVVALLSEIGIVGITILWSCPTVQAEKVSNYIIIFILGLVSMFVSFRTFGYPIGNNRGRIGEAAEKYRVRLIQRVFTSLASTGSIDCHTCNTPGCINNPVDSCAGSQAYGVKVG